MNSNDEAYSQISSKSGGGRTIGEITDDSERSRTFGEIAEDFRGKTVGEIAEDSEDLIQRLRTLARDVTRKCGQVVRYGRSKTIEATTTTKGNNIDNYIPKIDLDELLPRKIEVAPQDFKERSLRPKKKRPWYRNSVTPADDVISEEDLISARNQNSQIRKINDNNKKEILPNNRNSAAEREFFDLLLKIAPSAMPPPPPDLYRPPPPPQQTAFPQPQPRSSPPQLPQSLFLLQPPPPPLAPIPIIPPSPYPLPSLPPLFPPPSYSTPAPNPVTNQPLFYPTTPTIPSSQQPKPMAKQVTQDTQCPSSENIATLLGYQCQHTRFQTPCQPITTYPESLDPCRYKHCPVFGDEICTACRPQYCRDKKEECKIAEDAARCSKDPQTIPQWCMEQEMYHRLLQKLIFLEIKQKYGNRISDYMSTQSKHSRLNSCVTPASADLLNCSGTEPESPYCKCCQEPEPHNCKLPCIDNCLTEKSTIKEGSLPAVRKPRNAKRKKRVRVKNREVESKCLPDINTIKCNTGCSNIIGAKSPIKSMSKVCCVENSFEEIRESRFQKMQNAHEFKTIQFSIQNKKNKSKPICLNLDINQLHKFITCHLVNTKQNSPNISRVKGRNIRGDFSSRFSGRGSFCTKEYEKYRNSHGYKPYDSCVPVGNVSQWQPITKTSNRTSNEPMIYSNICDEIRQEILPNNQHRSSNTIPERKLNDNNLEVTGTASLYHCNNTNPILSSNNTLAKAMQLMQKLNETIELTNAKIKKEIQESSNTTHMHNSLSSYHILNNDKISKPPNGSKYCDHGLDTQRVELGKQTQGNLQKQGSSGDNGAKKKSLNHSETMRHHKSDQYFEKNDYISSYHSNRKPAGADKNKNRRNTIDLRSYLYPMTQAFIRKLSDVAAMKFRKKMGRLNRNRDSKNHNTPLTEEAIPMLAKSDNSKKKIRKERTFIIKRRQSIDPNISSNEEAWNARDKNVLKPLDVNESRMRSSASKQTSDTKSSKSDKYSPDTSVEISSISETSNMLVKDSKSSKSSNKQPAEKQTKTKENRSQGSNKCSQAKQKDSTLSNSHGSFQCCNYNVQVMTSVLKDKPIVQAYKTATSGSCKINLENNLKTFNHYGLGTKITISSNSSTSCDITLSSISKDDHLNGDDIHTTAFKSVEKLDDNITQSDALLSISEEIDLIQKPTPKITVDDTNKINGVNVDDVGEIIMKLTENTNTFAQLLSQQKTTNTDTRKITIVHEMPCNDLENDNECIQIITQREDQQNASDTNDPPSYMFTTLLEGGGQIHGLFPSFQDVRITDKVVKLTEPSKPKEEAAIPCECNDEDLTISCATRSCDDIVMDDISSDAMPNKENDGPPKYRKEKCCVKRFCSKKDNSPYKRPCLECIRCSPKCNASVGISRSKQMCSPHNRCNTENDNDNIQLITQREDQQNTSDTHDPHSYMFTTPLAGWGKIRGLFRSFQDVRVNDKVEKLTEPSTPKEEAALPCEHNDEDLTIYCATRSCDDIDMEDISSDAMPNKENDGPPKYRKEKCCVKRFCSKKDNSPYKRPCLECIRRSPECKAPVGISRSKQMCSPHNRSDTENDNEYIQLITQREDQQNASDTNDPSSYMFTTPLTGWSKICGLFPSFQDVRVNDNVVKLTEPSKPKEEDALPYECNHEYLNNTDTRKITIVHEKPCNDLENDNECIQIITQREDQQNPSDMNDPPSYMFTTPLEGCGKTRGLLPSFQDVRVTDNVVKLTEPSTPKEEAALPCECNDEDLTISSATRSCDDIDMEDISSDAMPNKENDGPPKYRKEKCCVKRFCSKKDNSPYKRPCLECIRCSPEWKASVGISQSKQRSSPHNRCNTENDNECIQLITQREDQQNASDTNDTPSYMITTPLAGWGKIRGLFPSFQDVRVNDKVVKLTEPSMLKEEATLPCECNDEDLTISCATRSCYDIDMNDISNDTMPNKENDGPPKYRKGKCCVKRLCYEKDNSPYKRPCLECIRCSPKCNAPVGISQSKEMCSPHNRCNTENDNDNIQLITQREDQQNASDTNNPSSYMFTTPLADWGKIRGLFPSFQDVRVNDKVVKLTEPSKPKEEAALPYECNDEYLNNTDTRKITIVHEMPCNDLENDNECIQIITQREDQQNASDTNDPPSYMFTTPLEGCGKTRGLLPSFQDVRVTDQVVKLTEPSKPKEEAALPCECNDEDLSISCATRSCDYIDMDNISSDTMPNKENDGPHTCRKEKCVKRFCSKKDNSPYKRPCLECIRCSPKFQAPVCISRSKKICSSYEINPCHEYNKNSPRENRSDIICQSRAIGNSPYKNPSHEYKRTCHENNMCKICCQSEQPKYPFGKCSRVCSKKNASDKTCQAKNRKSFLNSIVSSTRRGLNLCGNHLSSLETKGSNITRAVCEQINNEDHNCKDEPRQSFSEETCIFESTLNRDDPCKNKSQHSRSDESYISEFTLSEDSPIIIEHQQHPSGERCTCECTLNEDNLSATQITFSKPYRKEAQISCQRPSKKESQRHLSNSCTNESQQPCCEEPCVCDNTLNEYCPYKNDYLQHCSEDTCNSECTLEGGDQCTKESQHRGGCRKTCRKSNKKANATCPDRHEKEPCCKPHETSTTDDQKKCKKKTVGQNGCRSKTMPRKCKDDCEEKSSYEIRCVKEEKTAPECIPRKCYDYCDKKSSHGRCVNEEKTAPECIPRKCYDYCDEKSSHGRCVKEEKTAPECIPRKCYDYCDKKSSHGRCVKEEKTAPECMPRKCYDYCDEKNSHGRCCVMEENMVPECKQDNTTVIIEKRSSECEKNKSEIPEVKGGDRINNEKESTETEDDTSVKQSGKGKVDFKEKCNCPCKNIRRSKTNCLRSDDILGEQNNILSCEDCKRKRCCFCKTETCSPQCPFLCLERLRQEHHNIRVRNKRLANVSKSHVDYCGLDSFRKVCLCNVNGIGIRGKGASHHTGVCRDRIQRPINPQVLCSSSSYSCHCSSAASCVDTKLTCHSSTLEKPSHPQQYNNTKQLFKSIHRRCSVLRSMFISKNLQTKSKAVRKKAKSMLKSLSKNKSHSTST